jgi:hypothetical protein
MPSSTISRLIPSQTAGQNWEDLTLVEPPMRLPDEIIALEIDNRGQLRKLEVGTLTLEQERQIVSE